MPFSEQTVSVRGGRFSVRVRQAGAGAPLVYLHGSPGPLANELLEPLAQRFTVYQPTHPGWGESTGLDHLDDIIDLALFYYDLFDALGLTSVNLVGHSLGGMLAAEIAALNGSYVRRLVLCAPIGIWLDDCQPPDMYTLPDDEVAKLAFVNPPPRPVIDPEDRAAQARAVLEREKWRAASAKFVWPIWDKGLKKRIHRIKAPTLLLWGAHDGLVPPPYGPEFQRLIPGSQLVTFANSAHVPMVEEPQAWTQAVGDFLDR